MNPLSLRRTISAMLIFRLGLAIAEPYCKPIAGSPDWPAQSEWQALNESISGRLIAPVPPGVVCQPLSPLYNNDSCQLLYSQWSNSTFHAQNPFTSDYNDDTCLPSALAPCSAAGYPAYVVNATNAKHVQEGVKFAHKTGVRLIVKGTGHDWPGRSAGRDAISIYTHNIRGIEVNHEDERAIKSGGVASVKIAAGTQMAELYAVAAEKNITVVGGADLNVGIGGWITGAGHSPVSSKYGLGADQVIEMEVVTANGTFLTVNETSYPGLFWAMRGGGGSTFGILISVTVRAFPSLSGALYVFNYNTTANSETFWDLATLFHRQLPNISDSGAMGYYFLTADTGDQEPDPAIRGKLFGVWILPDKSAEEANATLAPFQQAIREEASKWPDQVHIDKSVTDFTDFSTFWQINPPESVGGPGRLGSRLLGRDALSVEPERLKRALRNSTLIPQFSILGHVIAGKGVKNADIVAGNNSVLPAWRDAITHVVLPRSWPYLNETVKEELTTLLREVEVEALRQISPGSGAYVNEADPTEPNWRETFWGDNYPRLLELKDYWDPTGVFWCVPCVGHGHWNVTSDFGIEGAIGQTPGRICRTS